MLIRPSPVLAVNTPSCCLLISRRLCATLSHTFLCWYGLRPYTCNGNNAKPNTLFTMHTIDKHTALMKALAERCTVLQTCKRINIEQKYPPHYRTFIAIQATMSREDLNKLEDIATEHLLECNVFKAGGMVSTVTFVDMDERRASPQG